MDVLWTKTFEYAHPVANVWHGYLLMQGAPDGVAPEVGLTYTLTDAAATRVEITDVIPEALLVTDERCAGRHLVTTVTFEATDIGAKVTITSAGFGEDDDFDVLTESMLVGYTESMQDLAVYLDTGVMRHGHLLGDRSATGVVWKQTPSGFVVRRISDGSLGDQAGLRPGDLLLAIDGAGIYTRAELWLLARRLDPGTEVEVMVVRDGAVVTGRGRMLSWTEAVTGEVGLGPRVEETV
jgi:hypothetical protein